MANNNNPFGLIWISNETGGPASILHIPKAAGTAVYIGDPVSRTAGLITAPTPGTTPYLGVSMDYAPANGALSAVSVVTSPDAIYCGQTFSATGITAAQMGYNANLHSGAGSTLTKQSGWTVDDTSAATTNTLDVHVLQLYGTITNSVGGYDIVEVIFNVHRLNGGVAGA
jgi:hypothetical protein